MSHEWRRTLMLDFNDRIWDDPDLVGLPQNKQDRIEAILGRAAREVCKVVGHESTPDHCGKPEHDYCVHCQAQTPGEAARHGS